MKIAFIGTGLMGRPMAERLLDSHYSLIVYNRTRGKAEALSEKGAEIADSAGEAVAAADCVILMLTDGKAIRDLLFSVGEQISFSGRTLIQMGTILPRESTSFLRRTEAAGGEYFEAPVLGSIPQAREAKLLVMVGSQPEQYQRWRPLLSCFGPEPLWVGTVGQAAALKLALNQLIASLTAAFSLSLGMVMRRDIDVQLFLKILRESALYAPTFDKKLPRYLNRDFNQPNFPTRHLLKDVHLILDEARSLGLETSALEGVRRVIEITLEKGFIDTDYSSIFNGINPSEPKHE